MAIMWQAFTLLAFAVVVCCQSTCHHTNQPSVPDAKVKGETALHKMASGFLDKVTGTLPLIEVKKLIRVVSDGQYSKVQGLLWPITSKQAGFVLCLVAGILAAITMPLAAVGIFLCRSGQKPRELDKKWKFVFTAILVVCCAFWLSSAVLYLKNNNDVHPRLKGLREKSIFELTHLQAYAGFAVKQVGCLGKDVASTLKKAINKTTIQKLQEEAFDTAVQVAGLSPILQLLPKLHKSTKTELASIRNKGNQAERDTKELKTKINNALASVTSNPAIDQAKDEINTEMDDLIKTVQTLNGNEYKPDVVKSQVEDANKEIDKMKEQITEEVDQKEIHAKVDSNLEPVNKALTEVAEKIEGFNGDLANAKADLKTELSDSKIDGSLGWVKHFLRFLSIPLFLILGGLIVGMSLGYVGGGNKISGIGGKILRLTGYLALTLGVIPIIVTTALFFFGYTTETLVCEPIFGAKRNEPLLDLISEELQKNIQIDKVTLNVTTILNTCQNNGGVTKALNFTTDFEIPKFEVPKFSLDASKITEAANKIKDITDKLRTLKTKTIPDIRNKVTAYDVEQKLAGIDEICKRATCSPGISSEILARKTEAETLKHSYLELLQEADQATITSQATIDTLDNAETQLREIAGNPDPVVKAVREKVTQTSRQLLSTFTGYIKDQVENQHGQCGPVYRVFQNLGRILCHYVAPPLNGAWFSLGIGMVALVPTVACSFKLSDFFVTN